ncbi:MAG: ferrochelatase, partial [Silvanigrellaceae bacterium]|nr:ferrochelatase [Silvanigrellaceae bacterium]
MLLKSQRVIPKRLIEEEGDQFTHNVCRYFKTGVSMNSSKIGVLLINLGTPDNCDPKSVYAYLKQFLNDPRVIDLPTVVRYVLVNWLIIPFRYKQSAHAYKQIWSD